MPKATGSFEVKLAPLDAYNSEPSAKLGRMSLDKQFQGDLDATSKGEMLHIMSDIKGSAAAVAIERVGGSLGGKSGSFALYHVGVMQNNTPSLWNVKVAPDSGTGELTGITGEMKIIIEGKSHSYEFEKELPE